MTFLRARRASVSDSSPLRLPVPAPNSPKPGKQSGSRSKTVSSTIYGEEGRVDAHARDAHSNGDVTKEACSGWGRLKLGQEKSERGRGGAIKTADGPVPRRTNRVDMNPHSIDMELESEWRRLAATKAKIEEEVREHTELLRLLRCRREKVAEQGERLRRSVFPEKRPSTPKTRFTTPDPDVSSPRSRFTTPDPETPPPSRPPSPSAARKACHEAYARMSPLRQHLMRDQLHREGIRPRDIRREQEERREWEEHQRRSRQHPRFESSSRSEERERASRDRDRKRRKEEMHAETMRLENVWRDRERREMVEAWEMYESRWAFLSSSPPTTMRLHDIPWPIVFVFFTMPHRTWTPNATASLTDLFSPDAVSTFVFSGYHSEGKTRKQRLREALLRYHPDRFEGRWLRKVPEVDRERERVREAVGVVARILGRLLKEEP